MLAIATASGPVAIDGFCSMSNIQHGYMNFLEALHDTTGRIVQRLDPAMVLDVFYASMIRPMMFILEISNKTLYKLCDDVDCRNIFLGKSGPFCNPWIFATAPLPSFDSNDTLVGGLKRFIDLVELK